MQCTVPVQSFFLPLSPMRQMHSPIFFADRPDEVTGAIARIMADMGLPQLMVLCDRNTLRDCYPLLAPLPGFGADAKVCVLPPGEEHKHLARVEDLLRFLKQNLATRNTLLVNLGGGVVCDLGGFAAAVYKRGVPFVNIPTTLIAQADAAIGGKTGVNFDDSKNLIGAFNPPEAVVICHPFLRTLPPVQWRSGMGELFKYTMIGAGISLEDLRRVSYDNSADLLPVIRMAAEFKQSVVERDPFEKGYRKILNFGHTIGHAIESASLRAQKTISHGEAVAAGVVAETFLSHVINGLDKDVLDRVVEFYHENFSHELVMALDPETITSFLFHDKKSSSPGLIQPVLLAPDGTPGFDYSVTAKQCIDSLNYLAASFQ